MAFLGANGDRSVMAVFKTYWKELVGLMVLPNKHTQLAAARPGRRKRRGASGVRRYAKRREKNDE